MPSAIDHLRAASLTALLACAFGGAGQGWAQQTPAEPPAPTREQVQSAREKVKADPNLGGTRQEKTLRLKKTSDDDSRPKDKRDARHDAPSWLAGLARWLAEAGRLLVWALGAIAVALLVVSLRHWIKVRGDAAAIKAGVKLPSHVRELDIRPESLPDRIGAAARDLWQGGEQHAALSLLYRGALSRLVHDHGVPIRAASTEGECVQLANRRLNPERGAFFGQLVGAWQLAVYGARLPDGGAMLALCDAFDMQLGPRLAMDKKDPP